jgi:hypothetical protein
MPAILHTAQLPRRDRENPDSKRLEADAGSSVKSKAYDALMPGSLSIPGKRREMSSHQPRHISCFQLSPCRVELVRAILSTSFTGFEFGYRIPNGSWLLESCGECYE